MKQLFKVSLIVPVALALGACTLKLPFTSEDTVVEVYTHTGDGNDNNPSDNHSSNSGGPANGGGGLVIPNNSNTTSPTSTTNTTSTTNPVVSGGQ